MKWETFSEYCIGFFGLYAAGTVVYYALQSLLGLASLFLLGLIVYHAITK